MANYRFRNADARYPFLWEGAAQPAGRWHAAGRGPAQYLADTPDGAWAEFLRHEAITEEADLAGIERNLWTIAVDDHSEDIQEPAVDAATLMGGLNSYPACQAAADSLRAAGATALRARAACLQHLAAGGQATNSGALVELNNRDGLTLVLFGPRPNVAGWLCCDRGRPAPRLLALVRQL